MNLNATTPGSDDYVQKPLRATFPVYQGQPYVCLVNGPLRLEGCELSANDLQRLGEQFTALARIAKTTSTNKAISWVQLA